MYERDLLEKYKRKKERKLKFRWENALSDVARNLRQLNYSINRWGGDDVWGHEHILGNFWSHGIPGIFMWNTRNDT